MNAPEPASEGESRGEVLVLNTDLFFGVKIGNALKARGYAVVFKATTDAFVAAARADRPALAIIDLNARPEWERIAELTAEGATPILVFGSHLDIEGLRAAKAAGVSRVVSNGEFHRNMLDLVERYARHDG
jgi:DNA-binding NarL/FixJ family response regulator